MNIISYRTHFAPPAMARYVIAFLAILTSVALQTCTTAADEAQAAQPGATPAKTDSSLSEESIAQLHEQVSRAVEGLESALPRVRERFGQDSPNFVQSQKKLTKLHELQKRLMELSQGEFDEGAKAQLSLLRHEIAAVTVLLPPTADSGLTNNSSKETRQQLQQLQDQLAQQAKQLAERERQLEKGFAERQQQLAMAARQMARPQLPPLENGTLKVYRLAHANAREGAVTVESLFGTQSMRVAVDDRSNSLVVYGKPDVLSAIEALLMRLDDQTSPNANEKATPNTPSTRSLMVRVFWLADNVPKTGGQDPADFLPKSVLSATQKLGLEKPRLITQTVNALATGKDDSVEFSSDVPALLMDQPVGLGCEGKLKLVGNDRVRLEMRVHVDGQSMNCDLRGSMATPLGHYMVLGTANSMIADNSSAGEGTAAGPGMSMGPAGRPGQAAPGVAPGAPSNSTAALPGGLAPGRESRAMGPAASPYGIPPAKPKFETSRFAFVVQVVDGQSYEADKAKAERD